MFTNSTAKIIIFSIAVVDDVMSRWGKRNGVQEELKRISEVSMTDFSVEPIIIFSKQ
jgi:hypothetical protein